MPTLGGIVVHTGAAATDRRRLIDMKNELARAHNPDDENTLALAQDSINSAIRVYNRYEWPWERLVAGLSFVSGVETQPLPQPFKKPAALYILDDARSYKRLSYISYETYRNEYTLKKDGEPIIYTLRNVHEDGLVLVWPRPTRNYAMEIDYYRRTPLLTSDEAPFDGPPEAEEAIMSWAWYEFCKRIGGEFAGGRVSVAYQEARAARAELVAYSVARGDEVGIV